jgi:glutaredoxin 3
MVEAKVYSASYCPWCDKAVEFLKKFEDLDVWIVDVTDNQELRETISKKTGQNTVPQILIGNTYIGGYDAMMKMASTKELDLTILRENNRLLKEEVLRIRRSLC